MAEPQALLIDKVMSKECLKTKTGSCEKCPWLMIGQNYTQVNAEPRSTTDYISKKYCPPGQSPIEDDIKLKAIVGIDSLIIAD